MSLFNGTRWSGWATSCFVMVFLGGCALVIDFDDYEVGEEGGSAGVSGSASGNAGAGGSAGASSSSSGSAGAGGNPDCMANLLTDPLNCGTCGTDCLGGTCDQGSCTPVLMAATSSAPFGRMAIHGEYVYWTSKGSIYRLQKLATSATMPTPVIAQVGADFIAVDDEYVYYTIYDVSGSINYVRNDGSGLNTNLLSGIDSPIGLTLYQGLLYWATDHDPGAVQSIPKTDGQVTLVKDSLVKPYLIRVDGSDVYVTYRGKSVMDGGVYASTGMGVSGFSAPAGLAVDAKYFFFLTGNAALVRVDRSTGTTMQIGSGNGPISEGAVDFDARYVYWTGAGGESCGMDCACTDCGTIYRVLKGMGPLETFAAPGNAWTTARDLVVNGGAVYWTTSDSVTGGKLFRKAITKP